MDYFNDVLTTLLGLECGSSLAMQGQKALDKKKIWICVSKMKKCDTGLERHEGE